MNFRNRRTEEAPEINLIPLIDVLLVILIFLAATTSFARYTQLEVTLPEAAVELDTPPAITIDISRDGRYAINGTLIDAPDTAALADNLSLAVVGKASPLLLINADAQAAHQAVVNVMEAARLAGIARVNFAAQNAR